MLYRIISILVIAISAWNVNAIEIQSPSLTVKTIFAQGVREDPNHPHSDKILVSLNNMSWVGAGCSSVYFYIYKSDFHLFSLLLNAHTKNMPVSVTITDTDVLNGVCRATMVSSPNN